MSVKKLSFYLDSARITVRSDHLPLKKFLEKNTMNAKVNNWAVELESQKIDFVFIPGIKNVLADTLSRLIEVDNDVKLPEEKEGEKFGYIPFEKLPPAQVEVMPGSMDKRSYSGQGNTKAAGPRPAEHRD